MSNLNKNKVSVSDRHLCLFHQFNGNKILAPPQITIVSWNLFFPLLVGFNADFVIHRSLRGWQMNYFENTWLGGWQMNYFEPSADDPDLMMGRQPYSKDIGWSATYIPSVLYYLWSFKWKIKYQGQQLWFLFGRRIYLGPLSMFLIPRIR